MAYASMHRREDGIGSAVRWKVGMECEACSEFDQGLQLTWYPAVIISIKHIGTWVRVGLRHQIVMRGRASIGYQTVI